MKHDSGWGELFRSEMIYTDHDLFLTCTLYSTYKTNKPKELIIFLVEIKKNMSFLEGKFSYLNDHIWILGIHPHPGLGPLFYDGSHVNVSFCIVFWTAYAILILLVLHSAQILPVLSFLTL